MCLVSQQESTVCGVHAPDLRGLISSNIYMKMNIKHTCSFTCGSFSKALAHAPPDIFYNSDII